MSAEDYFQIIDGFPDLEARARRDRTIFSMRVRGASMDRIARDLGIGKGAVINVVRTLASFQVPEVNWAGKSRRARCSKAATDRLIRRCTVEARKARGEPKPPKNSRRKKKVRTMFKSDQVRLLVAAGETIEMAAQLAGLNIQNARRSVRNSTLKFWPEAPKKKRRGYFDDEWDEADALPESVAASMGF